MSFSFQKGCICLLVIAEVIFKMNNLLQKQKVKADFFQNVKKITLGKAKCILML